MKKYDSLMQNLRFREDFCEDTVRKAQALQTRRPLFRGLAVAACICVCTMALIGTALAFPQIRELFFSDPVEAVENVFLPDAGGTMMENRLEAITARYYKLDGVLNAHEGIGSVIPVTKDGVTAFYSIAENGELQIADATRRIHKELCYEGKTYTLDMQIYEGDMQTVVMGEHIFPLLKDDTYVLRKKVGGVYSQLFVNLETWEIEDPMVNVDFALPEGAVEAHAYANRGGSLVLIEAELHDGSGKIYCAMRETGEVRFVEDAAIAEWFMCDGKVYRYRDGMLSELNEKGEILPLFGGKQCNYLPGSRIASVQEGDHIRLLLLPTGEEILLEEGAELFCNLPSAQPNQALTKICATLHSTSDFYNSGVLAIADMETGKLVSLERKSGLREQMHGWFDDNTFMIAGTIGEDWYVCLYDVGE